MTERIRTAIIALFEAADTLGEIAQRGCNWGAMGSKNPECRTTRKPRSTWCAPCLARQVDQARLRNAAADADNALKILERGEFIEE